MEDELLMRDLRDIECKLDTLTDDGMNYQKWFVSFGSLLYMVRDKKLGVEFNQDIDISLLPPFNQKRIIDSLIEEGFELVTHIVDDQTKEILFADLKSKNGLSVDLFFWIEHNGYYWHTYDYMAERKPDGIPGKYHFKSVPAWMMQGTPYHYEWFPEISRLKMPNLYGTLLDYWYPHWFIPDSEFGQSRADIIVEPKTCANLGRHLNIS